ncbi:MAG: RNA-directed DNA polymerase [Bacteroides sp.]|nr:RNA-directed DNA polymerase [Bacillota bacterium]MCM1394335.1 RNA-directed DNA polymerase [[Eubacterium] siraeum]MCM1456109.1 RNA-directed DNA polymerase [Bacteroides sp.]
MITTSYEELFTFKALYRAHLRGRRSKRDKKPLVRFELSTLQNIVELHKKLQSGKYRNERYHSFLVEEPKVREIQTLPYSNRVVQHVLCDDLLSPYFTKRAILDNCVCQKGKGEHFALDRFESMLRSYLNKNGIGGYFLKCDIMKYFPSIPHDELKRTICTHISDGRIKKLVSDIIDGYHTKPAFLERYNIEALTDERGTGRGIPIGNQTSQIFGMFYLDKVDRLVKEQMRIKVYSRYMDDFVLVHKDRSYLQAVLSEIERAVSELGLRLNGKTQIFPIKNGVTYLGFRFIVTPEGKIVRMIKKQTKKRLRWRARLLKKAYLDNLIPISRVELSKAAMHGHLKHGNCYKFEKELNGKLDFADADT